MLLLDGGFPKLAGYVVNQICIQFMVYQDPILSSPNPIFFCLVFRQPATIKNFKNRKKNDENYEKIQKQ